MSLSQCLREGERERVCVCVCLCVRERERVCACVWIGVGGAFFISSSVEYFGPLDLRVIGKEFSQRNPDVKGDLPGMSSGGDEDGWEEMTGLLP